MICPKCKSTSIQIIEESFDYGAGHHGSAGVEIIKYPACEDCGYGEQDGEDDWETTEDALHEKGEVKG